MTDPTTDLAAWKASNDVRRVDEANRFFGPTQWGDGAGSAHPLSQTTEAHGAYEVEDEWQMLEAHGFYQREDGNLRLMPLVVYPGVVLAPYVETYTLAPPNAALWLVIAHQLGSTSYPTSGKEGWNGQILATKAVLEWGTQEPRTNQIFPGNYDNSLPPNNAFIWNGRIGTTDAKGKFTRFSGDLDTTCGQFIPPY
jgi:hypothetical protein